MVCAWMRMCKNTNGQHVTSYEFERVRRLFSELLKGKKHGKRTKEKRSQTMSKLKWWNDGIVEIRNKECPGEGWIKGRLFSTKGLHHWSPEKRKRISEMQKGKQAGENNPAFGRHWWNNGVEQKYQRECPGEGWVLGFLSIKGKSHPAWNKGKHFHFTEDQKMKLYATRRGKTPPNKGKSMSEEQKSKA